MSFSVSRPGISKRASSPAKNVISVEMPNPVQKTDIDRLTSKLVKIEEILQALSTEIP